MGWITTIVIRNDCLHNIENDKDFGKTLDKRIREQLRANTTVSVPSGGSHAADVVAQRHNNQTTFICVTGNTAFVVDPDDVPKKLFEKYDKN